MNVETFTFGDPLPAIDQRDIMGLFHSAWSGKWYEPPMSFDGLAKALNANPHHQSAIHYKASLLASRFRPSRLLSRQDFRRLALDFLVLGNAWVERRQNRLGSTLRLQPTVGRWTRVTRDGAIVLHEGQDYAIAGSHVLHLMNIDINQEIYGMPDYTAALQSAFLNEAATLFRRRYYLNGTHAGFILYISDPLNSQDDVEKLRDQMKGAKGIGNFKNMLLYAPSGKKDGVQLIPVSEVAAKDEFFSMKNVTRDDILAAHRVPPQLLGIVPSNAGGFGSVENAAAVFIDNEIKPLMTAFEVVNDWCGEQAVAWIEA
ncbi:phage portal protein [Haematospirillum sp. 15-248]|uniref:phage portal protein n=1 Tax=Haematospirillum sp. 15-248 TaxID=2723107 RepID=UPI001439B716|nr:phage portal protein [Haematospirillum sp. 15-248]NKD88755.1 phage portal protein [Haematospirillum sp. 15-248]